MTPLEQVTDLLVCLQLADNRIDYSEKEARNATLKRLFPDVANPSTKLWFNFMNQ